MINIRMLAFAGMAFSSMAAGAPFDLLMNQRNIADTATAARVLPLPALNTAGVVGISPFTNLPMIYKLGNSFMVDAASSNIESASRWVNVTGKPIFADVATSGDYNDLINKPTMPGSQVNADWNAVGGLSEILNKPSLSLVATSGSYSDLSGKPSIPSAQINSDWSAASGLGQILNKPTTLSGYGITDAYPLSGNPAGYLTGISSGQVTAALGFTPYSASNPSSYVSQSGARSSISLTTTGTGGAATYNSSTGVLNIPNYAPGTGTVTSVTAGSGLSGGTITTSGTISMPSVGSPGSYSSVTTDAQGRVTSGLSRAFSNPARALNAAFQISPTRDAHVTYTVDISVTSLLLAGASGRVYLEYADDASMTANVVTVNSSPNATGGVLNVTNLGAGNVSGWIPAGKYARIRTANVSGSPTFTFQVSQEVLH